MVWSRQNEDDRADGYSSYMLLVHEILSCLMYVAIYFIISVCLTQTCFIVAIDCSG